MPYSSVSEAEEKNPGLAKYGAKAKRGWLKSFNSCMDKGGSESKCFAIAYSVANKVDGKKASVFNSCFKEHHDDGKCHAMAWGVAKKGSDMNRVAKELLRVAKKMIASTRSMIGILQPSGGIRSIYCNYDSYKNLGVLKRSYNSRQLAEMLVGGGDISSLEVDPSKLERLSKDVTFSGNYQQWMNKYSQDYMLLFMNGRWVDVSHGMPSSDDKPPASYADTYEAENALRSALGVAGGAQLIFKTFMTFTEGTSNKYHYFAVWEDRKTGEAVGGNAYGKIGGTPSAMELARGSRSVVMSAVQRKVRTKLMKDYKTQD